MWVEEEVQEEDGSLCISSLAACRSGASRHSQALDPAVVPVPAGSPRLVCQCHLSSIAHGRRSPSHRSFCACAWGWKRSFVLRPALGDRRGARPPLLPISLLPGRSYRKRCFARAQPDIPVPSHLHVLPLPVLRGLVPPKSWLGPSSLSFAPSRLGALNRHVPLAPRFGAARRCHQHPAWLGLVEHCCQQPPPASSCHVWWLCRWHRPSQTAPWSC